MAALVCGAGVGGEGTAGRRYNASSPPAGSFGSPGPLRRTREFLSLGAWLFPEGLNCCTSHIVRFLIESGKSINSYGGCSLLRILLERKRSRQR